MSSTGEPISVRLRFRVGDFQAGMGRGRFDSLAEPCLGNRQQILRQSASSAHLLT